MEPAKKAKPGNSTDARDTGSSKDSKAKSSIFSQKPLIGGPGDRRLISFGKRVLPFLAIIVLFTGGYVAYDRYFAEGDTDRPRTGAVTKDSVTPISVSLEARARRGDVQGSLQEFDRRIQATNDESVKRELLVKQAVVAFNHKEYELAKKQLLEAEKIKGGHKVWGLLGSVLEAQKKFSEAADYYQKAADDTTTHNVSANKYRLQAEEMRTR